MHRKSDSSQTEYVTWQDGTTLPLQARRDIVRMWKRGKMRRKGGYIRANHNENDERHFIMSVNDSIPRLHYASLQRTLNECTEEPRTSSELDRHRNPYLSCSFANLRPET